VASSITGFGALQPFFGDPDIEEIWINGPSSRLHRARRRARTPGVLLTDTEGTRPLDGADASANRQVA
jgi:pilus assembly protein CpaF